MPVLCCANGSGTIQDRRKTGKLQVILQTITKYPLTVVWPLLLFCVLTALGVFGVFVGIRVLYESRRADALQIASSTLAAFSLVVQQSYAPVLALGVYLERQPLWPPFSREFNNMASKLLEYNGEQNSTFVQLEVAPNGVISSVYPDLVGGLGLDLLECCAEAAMNEVDSQRLVLEGPVVIQQQKRVVFIASLPVFVNSSVLPPGPDPAWQLPSSHGGCINASACYTPINGTTGRKWYGTVYAIIFVEELVMSERAKVRELHGMGWSYRLYRSSSSINDPALTLPMVAQSRSRPSDPVVTSMNISVGSDCLSSNAHGCVATYELELAPAHGWLESWWPAVYVAVLIVNAIIAGLLATTLLSKRQNSWLLYSILPKHVVRTLRGGRPWSHKTDCCVLFADVVQFTRMSVTMSPEDVVEMIGTLFGMFEDLTAQHGMTKVDIIGDCYMAVSGMLAPLSPEEGAACAARLALDMVQCTDNLVTQDGEPVQIRVGLHAGPVVAAVLGAQSPKLTIFGDVVNTCSRLQTTSLPGAVQVSGTVAERLIASGALADGLALVERGRVELRNRGAVHTWWLERVVEDDVGPLGSNAPAGSVGGETIPTISLSLGPAMHSFSHVQQRGSLSDSGQRHTAAPTAGLRQLRRPAASLPPISSGAPIIGRYGPPPTTDTETAITHGGSSMTSTCPPAGVTAGLLGRASNGTDRDGQASTSGWPQESRPGAVPGPGHCPRRIVLGGAGPAPGRSAPYAAQNAAPRLTGAGSAASLPAQASTSTRRLDAACDMVLRGVPGMKTDPTRTGGATSSRGGTEAGSHAPSAALPPTTIPACDGTADRVDVSVFMTVPSKRRGSAPDSLVLGGSSSFSSGGPDLPALRHKHSDGGGTASTLGLPATAAQEDVQATRAAARAAQYTYIGPSLGIGSGRVDSSNRAILGRPHNTAVVEVELYPVDSVALGSEAATEPERRRRPRHSMFGNRVVPHAPTYFTPDDALAADSRLGSPGGSAGGSFCASGAVTQPHAARRMFNRLMSSGGGSSNLDAVGGSMLAIRTPSNTMRAPSRLGSFMEAPSEAAEAATQRVGSGDVGGGTEPLEVGSRLPSVASRATAMSMSGPSRTAAAASFGSNTASRLRRVWQLLGLGGSFSQDPDEGTEREAELRPQAPGPDALHMYNLQGSASAVLDEALPETRAASLSFVARAGSGSGVAAFAALGSGGNTTNLASQGSVNAARRVRAGGSAARLTPSSSGVDLGGDGFSSHSAVQELADIYQAQGMVIPCAQGAASVVSGSTVVSGSLGRMASPPSGGVAASRANSGAAQTRKTLGHSTSRDAFWTHAGSLPVGSGVLRYVDRPAQQQPTSPAATDLLVRSPDSPHTSRASAFGVTEED